MMRRKTFLMMFVIFIGLSTNGVYAARSKFKKASDNEQSLEEGSIVQQAQDAPEDLDISTEQEESAGGFQEPIIVQAPESQQPTRANNNDDDVDEKAKQHAVKNLVERGTAYLKKNDASHTFGKFTHTNEFMHGELYLFVFDSKGVCLAHGQQNDLLWKNLYDLRDSYGAPIVKFLIDKAEQGGGWITYNWRNATKRSYVQQVKKGDKTYVVGCGYYPHSKADAVVNLVKGAVALFNDYKMQKRSKEEAFSTYSYPMGRFVFGDLYLYALDFKGTLMAQGDRPGLIGSNAWDYKDSNGKFANQEIIKKLQNNPDQGIWVDYTSHRAHKKAYAERVEDDKGNSYAVVCGYYPDANRDQAVDLVKKGYQFMKAQGKSLASEEFSKKGNDTYRYGDLNLLVYDLEGMCIANGSDPDQIGQKQFDLKDDDGRYYVRALIEQAKQGPGWVDFKIKNSFESVYVEEVDLGLNKYIICCGTFPVSKAETMSLLVRSAEGFLQANPDDMAFAEFTKENGKFIRGDLSIFVFDVTGLCYAYGDEYDLIWQNLMSAKDDAGKSIAKLFIDTAEKGAAKVSYTVGKVPKNAFVDKVEKGEKAYIIGSSFYR